MEAKALKTDYGTIRYWVMRSNDNAPWLVFLPGLSADHTLFEKQITFFSPKYNCILWDAPAHGLSRPFALKFSMEDIAEYLHIILSAEKAEKIVLIGQSFGGYISQVFLSRYHHTITGFISIDSCPLSRKFYTRWELALLKHTKWMYRSIPWKLLLKWGIWGTSTTNYGRSLMEKMWSIYDKREFCNLADHGYRIVAKAVEAKESYPLFCPVLLLCGEKDAAGSAKQYNREWAKQDGHRLIWLKDAGHNSNTDTPDEVNRHIENFIRSL